MNISNAPPCIKLLDEMGYSFGDQIPKSDIDKLIECAPLPPDPTIVEFQQWQMRRMGLIGKFLDTLREFKGMVLVRPHGEIATILRPNEQAQYASQRFFKKFSKEVRRSIEDIECVDREKLTDKEIKDATDKAVQLHNIKGMVKSSTRYSPFNERNG